MTKRKYLNVNQVAEMLGVHRSSVYRYISSHGLPYYKIGGGRLLFDPERVEAWVESQTEKSNNGFKLFY